MSIALFIAMSVVVPARAAHGQEANDGSAPGKAAEDASDNEISWTDWWADGFILVARTQIRSPNDWRSFRSGINVFLGPRPRAVEVAIHIGFIGLNPDRPVLEQPGFGVAASFLKRRFFVGAAAAIHSDVHDKLYVFVGLSGFKDIIQRKRDEAPSAPNPSPPTPSPTPSPSPGPSATPAPDPD